MWSLKRASPLEKTSRQMTGLPEEMNPESFLSVPTEDEIPGFRTGNSPHADTWKHRRIFRKEMSRKRQENILSLAFQLKSNSLVAENARLRRWSEIKMLRTHKIKGEAQTTLWFSPQSFALRSWNWKWNWRLYFSRTRVTHFGKSRYLSAEGNIFISARLI